MAQQNNMKDLWWAGTMPASVVVGTRSDVIEHIVWQVVQRPLSKFVNIPLGASPRQPFCFGRKSISEVARVASFGPGKVLEWCFAYPAYERG